MIAAIATPNHIMGWVMFWLWVSVVMEFALPHRRGPQGWDLPVLGDPPTIKLSSNTAVKLLIQIKSPPRVPQVSE
jgi:hypothetical protein